MFVIEDQFHCETLGRFSSFELASTELKRIATLPWDQEPNRAPCMQWPTCGRSYEIIEYDDSSIPWKELRRIPVLDVSASGVKWVFEL